MSSSKPSFQLPTLTPINVSLTDGTNIPPPQDSPDETRPPTSSGGPLSSHPTTPHASAFGESSEGGYFGHGTNGAMAAANRKGSTGPGQLNTAIPGETFGPRPHDSPVAASTKRPSSVRRFLGLRSLRSSDSLHENNNNTRPPSRMTIDSRASTYLSNGPASPGLARKKSSRWFGKRKSTMFAADYPEASIAEEKENKLAKVPRGPPPPSIPEFKAFGTDLNGGDLGADDLFKNIR